MFKVFNNSVEICLTMTGDPDKGINTAALRLAQTLTAQEWVSDGQKSRLLENCHPSFRDQELPDYVSECITELKAVIASSRQLLSSKDYNVKESEKKKLQSELDRVLKSQQDASQLGSDQASSSPMNAKVDQNSERARSPDISEPGSMEPGSQASQ
eukprot:UN34102